MHVNALVVDLMLNQNKHEWIQYYSKPWFSWWNLTFLGPILWYWSLLIHIGGFKRLGKSFGAHPKFQVGQPWRKFTEDGWGTRQSRICVMEALLSMTWIAPKHWIEETLKLLERSPQKPTDPPGKSGVLNQYQHQTKPVDGRNPAPPWMVETCWNPMNNGMFTTYQLVQDFAGPSTVSPALRSNGRRLRAVELRPGLNSGEPLKSSQV